LLKIAICDDKPQEIEIAKQNLQIYLTSHPKLIVDVSVFFSAMELLCKAEENGGFDILLLDIFMPGILGIEVAQQLQKGQSNSQIIFLTTSRDYAVEAFAVNAVHYLVKPYSSEDFISALDKAVERAMKNFKQYLTLQNRGSVYVINLKKILYVEAVNHSQFVYSATEPTVELRMTMNELFKTIASIERDFYRMGASYIVNLLQIRQLSSKEMVLNGGKQLKIPRGAFPEIKKAHLRALFREVN